MTGHILHKVCAQNSCSHKIPGQDLQVQEQEQTDAVTTSVPDNFCCYICDISCFFSIHRFGDALLRQTEEGIFFVAAALFLETYGQGVGPVVLAVRPLAHK